MALEGRLSEFTLEEILQLIALQQKTGVLTVDASYPMVLYFENGELVSYRDRRGTTPDPLKIYLRSYGFLESENWEHIEFIQQNSSLDLSEILVNEGHFGPEELLRIQHDVVQEHIFRGMLLRDGRYRFRSERDVLQGLKGRIRVKVEGLLMEAARRIDEIASLEERFFDESVRIRRTDTPLDERPLGERMLGLLEVVGAENTLGWIVSHGRMSYFDVLQTLDMLCEENLLRVLDRPAPKEEKEPAAKPADDRPPLATAATWVVLLFALTALGISWWMGPSDGYAKRPTEAAERARVFRWDQQTARLNAALDLFHQAEGSYPSSLGKLLSPLYLGDRFPLSDYRYQRLSRDSYRLSRASETPITPEPAEP